MKINHVAALYYGLLLVSWKDCQLLKVALKPPEHGSDSSTTFNSLALMLANSEPIVPYLQE